VVGGLRQIVDGMGAGRMPSPCSVGQLEQIVGDANHRPLASDLVEAPQQELPKASGPLDLSVHRLEDLLAQAVALRRPAHLSFLARAALRDPFGHGREAV